MPTDVGICHVFNSLPVYRESRFTEAVKEAYGGAEVGGEALPRGGEEARRRLHSAVPHGYGLGFTFLLDRQVKMKCWKIWNFYTEPYVRCAAIPFLIN